MFDRLSFFFTIVVFAISLFTLVFQNNYMFCFLQKERFLAQLNFFILSMVFLILSNNWIFFLFCWECLGISSFFLINFYKNKTGVFKSGFKAFVFNKISDLFLLLSCAVYYKITNTFCFLPNLCFFKNKNNQSLFTYFLFFLTISSFVKSAQFIFFFWLPDSMEAPIPASALIHSATLVSAGIYTLLRFNYYFFHTKVFFFISTFSLFSMFFFSLIACFQSDIKKILAFSTASNCAFIFFLISIRELSLSVLFFSIHGFLKSLCFFIFGALVVFNEHKQDLKNWNKVSSGFNFLVTLFLLQLFSLNGFPVTIFYFLKIKLFTIHNSCFLFYLTYFIVVCYTAFSYIYGLKVFFLIINPNKLLSASNAESIKAARNTTYVCFFYYIVIVLSFSLFFFFFKNNVTSVFKTISYFFIQFVFFLFFFLNKRAYSGFFFTITGSLVFLYI